MKGFASYPAVAAALAVSAFAVIVAATPAASSAISATYRFESPLVEPAGDGFSRLVFPAAIQAGRRGEPSLPFSGAALLLPPGEAIASVRIERRGWTPVPAAVHLYPRQDPRPIGAAPGGEPDPGRSFLYRSEVYAQDRWIDPPPPLFRTRFLRGHPIATGAFSPVGYNPAAGAAGYYAEITITIETEPSQAAAAARRLLRTDRATLERLAALVDNPGALPPLPPPENAGVRRAGTHSGGEAPPVDCLIVTRSAFAADFSPLVEFYGRRGAAAVIATVEEIESAYAGRDTQERIRNAVIDHYVNHGLEYLLLAGDSDGGPADVPYRGFYAAVQSSSLYQDDNIPADLYYAALDGTWNDDGDSLWGEPGEDDLYSEIAVGRAPVGSSAEAAAFIHKVTSYQRSPVSAQCRSALLLGEKLWNDPLTYGGDELDQLIGACGAHGFTTTGLPPDFDITKYYDRDLGTWSKTSVYSEVNAGTHWIFHAGHSNYNYVMRMLRADVNTTNFTNDGAEAMYPLVYSYGCVAGGFDWNDCIGEMMVTLPTFASAFIGNSRYGWFTEGTTNGPSHHFQREFVDAVFNEGITALGAANQRSKDKTVPFIDLPDEYEPGAHRWCFYTLNLLGDPLLDAWTDAPVPLVVSHNPAIGSGDDAFAAVVDAPGARGTLSSGGACLGTALADPCGELLIALADSIPAGADSLDFVVTAHNRIAYETRIGITETAGDGDHPPRLALLQNSPNPFNPATLIRFSLERPGPVNLRIYNAAGREIARIIDSDMPAGAHEIAWRADGCASGVYFYVLRADGATLGRKAVLLR